MSGIVGSRLNMRGSGLVGSLGTDGQVFTSSGAGAGAVYEDGASSDVVKLAETAVSGATTVAFDGYFTSDYNRYEVVVPDFISTGTTTDVWFRTRTGDSTNTGNYYVNINCQTHTDVNPIQQLQVADSGSNDWDGPTNYWKTVCSQFRAEAKGIVHFTIYDPLNTSYWKMMIFGTYNSGNESLSTTFGHGIYKQTAALSGVEVIGENNWTGNAYLYGYK